MEMKVRKTAHILKIDFRRVSITYTNIAVIIPNMVSPVGSSCVAANGEKGYTWLEYGGHPTIKTTERTLSAPIHATNSRRRIIAGKFLEELAEKIPAVSKLRSFKILNVGYAAARA